MLCWVVFDSCLEGKGGGGTCLGGFHSIIKV